MSAEASTSTSGSSRTHARNITEFSMSETLRGCENITSTAPTVTSPQDIRGNTYSLAGYFDSIQNSQSGAAQEQEEPEPELASQRPGSPFSQIRNFRFQPHRREATIDPRTAFEKDCIPPEHKHRTLVLCFDGTGDQFDGDNSNVVKLCELLKKDDAEQQLVYYQSGIGTYTIPGIITPVTSTMAKVADEMVAWNLDSHVKHGYEFLMQSYRPKDKICIFGFSRGAYTARALAGMLHKIGLLPPNNYQQVQFAYQMYTRGDQTGWAQSTAFKRAFCIEVEIEFIGVWDTVSSVGLIPRRLPFTTSNTLVKTFRHALALDERRAKFKANLWNRPSTEESLLGTPPPTRASTTATTGTWSKKSTTVTVKTPERPAKKARTSSKSFFAEVTDTIRVTSREKLDDDDKTPSASDAEKKRGSKEKVFEEVKAVVWGTEQDEVQDDSDPILSALERAYSERHSKPTDILEVWFAGCHCDIGGGSVSNESPHALSRISLRWMIRECFRTNTGIMFDVDRLREVGLDASTLYPYVVPRPPVEDVPAGCSIRSRTCSESSTSTTRNTTTSDPASSSGKGSTRSTKKNTLSRFLSRRLGEKLGTLRHRKQRTSSESDRTAVAEISGNDDTKKVLKNPERHIHGPLGELRCGTEEEEDLLDCLEPAYDQLSLKKFWWVLEVMPMEFKYQLSDNTWIKWMGMNLGRPRIIRKEEQEANGVKVHRSVRMRMEAMDRDRGGKKYRPRMKLHVEPTWVD